MAEHSSISSSEHGFRGRLPTAFLLAVMILAGAEIGFRTIDLRHAIPCAPRMVEYHATRHYLKYEGAAAVGIFGSSRARDGAHCPTIERTLAELGYPDLSVANYAMAGARGRENSDAIRFALTSGKPQIILYGVTLRQFLSNNEARPQRALFWDSARWQEEIRRNPREALTLLPNVIRSAIGEHYRTLEFRLKPMSVVDDAFRMWKYDVGAADGLWAVLRGDAFECPQRGEQARTHQLYPSASLRTAPASREDALLHLAALMVDGKYPMTEEQVAPLSEAMKRATAIGVAVVLFEIPIDQTLVRELPPGTMESFFAIAKQLAVDTGGRFVSIEELGLRFGPEDFLNLSHLNRRGAIRLSEALTRQIVAPLLRDRAAAGTTAER